MAGFIERVRATKARFDGRGNERDERTDALGRDRAGANLFALNDAEAIRGRFGELGFGRIEDFATVDGGPGHLPLSALERILGTADLIGVDFLYQGARVARAVGRVKLMNRAGTPLGYGTGFLVSPRVLMTNNHVLGSPADAAFSVVQFDYHEGRGAQPPTPQSFRLLPGELFVTSQPLDFTLVAVESVSASGQEAAVRGHLALRSGSGEPLIGERINIIQHPGGQPQMVTLRDNTVVDVLDHFFHYTSDTDRGSSGAPAFTDTWDLAALHHSGVPDVDDHGTPLLLDGSSWDGRDETVHQIRWKANEGVRLKSIVAAVEGEIPRQSVAAGRLLSAVLEGGGPVRAPVYAAASRVAAPQAQPPSPESAATGAPLVLRVRLEVPSGPGRAATTVGEVSVPLVFGLDPSAATWVPPAAATPDAEGDAAPAPPAGAAEPTGPDGEAYFDEAVDAAAANAFYEGLPTDGDPGARFDALHALLERTHRPILSYRTARLRHLYPWVDLHEDGRLRSIYSGAGFDVEEVIRRDEAIEVEQKRCFEEALRRETFGLESGALAAVLDDLETRLPYNCEHVVAQSWFGKRTPMKEDLHHLFTIEGDCNSFRNNIPYDQFGPEEEALRAHCGRREGDRFEPGAGKGAIARATLFFLLRYPGEVGDDARELQRQRLPVLLAWHEAYPVTRWERHRNQAIAAIQGNRNPLIDHPDWARSIDFARGFGVSGPGS